MDKNRVPNWNELLVLKYCYSVQETYAKEVASALTNIPSGTIATQLGNLWDKGYLKRHHEAGSASIIGRPLRRIYTITNAGCEYLYGLEQDLARTQTIYHRMSSSD